MVPAICYYYQYCIKIIDAYCSELKYRTKQFTETIYYGYRHVVDNSKW